ncbi:spore germination protein [Eubacteriales bacterium OttesenSCG-928-G02]|nr:spore germination protein [Eubacteriales bacterium OttesenSCG-928-G02]
MDFTSIEELEQKLGVLYNNCEDFIKKKFKIKESSVFICCIREIASNEFVSEKIIKPFLVLNDFKGFNGNFDQILFSFKNTPVKSVNDACMAMHSGSVLVAVESDSLYACLTAADTYFGRAVSEPSSDVTVKGPRAGLVENIDKNIIALRRIIRSPRLKIKTHIKGSETNTRIALLYIEGRADEKVVNSIDKKLAGIQATAIIDSGNIEMLLKNKRYALLPDMGSTEKTDKAASLLIAGRVIILCDGSPFAISAPYVFAESIQSPEDYLKTPYYATFVRILRFCALLVSLYLPALFLVAVSYTPEMVPRALVQVIEKMRENIPVSLLTELVLMLLVFEILREVGLRMPRTVGDAVGIVGSIVIGDAATEAGIASTTVILIVAISAVANFVTPTYMNAVVLLRMGMLVLGYLFSYFGIVCGTIILLCGLFSKQSFGVPYMTPIMPFNLKGSEDFLLAVPQKTLGRIEDL